MLTRATVCSADERRPAADTRRPAIDHTTDAARLEDLWAGGFGDAYTDRNAAAAAGRAAFWTRLLDQHPVADALEVGSNVGGNLVHVAAHPGVRTVTGVDVNHGALGQLVANVPAARAVRAAARQLPFADATFDLVFTVGVLIHQPEESLTDVTAEIVRCSRRFVLCAEYADTQTVEVPYRGEAGALFRRDYVGHYRRTFPQLAIVEQGHLGEGSGFDDVTWALFEQPS